MSLDPKYLEHVADEIADKWEEFETEILEDIAKRIKAANYKATSTAQWKYWKLRELGLQSDYLGGELSRMLDITEKEINSIMSQAIDLSVQNDLNLMRGLKVLPNSYQITPYTSIVSRAAFNTFHEVKNWTGSMYSNTTKTFEHALDRAYLNVSSGLMTEKQAIEQAVNQLAREGILKSHTVNGRAERADVIVRRAVRTGTNITNGKVMDSILDDLDCDLVETSSHMGARPSHAEWQGKVFSRSGRNKKYPNFSVTGFGQIDGLMGINCRHSYYPFFEGLSTISARQYNIHENNIAYELEQKQRRAENGKKHWERRKRIKDAVNIDVSKESKKVIEWQKKLSETQEIKEKAKELIEIAKQVEPQITKDISKLSELYGGHLEGLEFRLKAQDSLIRKIEGDLASGKGLPRVTSELYDIVRYTSVSNSNNVVNHYNGIVEKLKQQGYNVDRVRNSLWDTNSAYRGINIVVSSPEKYFFELQIHTTDSLKLKEVIHKLYEKQRVLPKGSKEWEILKTEMVEKSRELIVDEKVQSIKNIEMWR